MMVRVKIVMIVQEMGCVDPMENANVMKAICWIIASFQWMISAKLLMLKIRF